MAEVTVLDQIRADNLRLQKANAELRHQIETRDLRLSQLNRLLELVSGRDTANRALLSLLDRRMPDTIAAARAEVGFVVKPEACEACGIGFSVPE